MSGFRVVRTTSRACAQNEEALIGTDHYASAPSYDVLHLSKHHRVLLDTWQSMLGNSLTACSNTRQNGSAMCRALSTNRGKRQPCMPSLLLRMPLMPSWRCNSPLPGRAKDSQTLSG